MPLNLCSYLSVWNCNDDEVMHAVRSNPEFIGYIDASKVDDTVKVLFSM